MKKSIFITLLVLSSIICGNTVDAQNSIAFVNTLDIINSLPDKSSATEKLNTLNENYKQELQIMQNEYNKKYSDFITYQKNLAESIKLRRMQELTDLENRIQNFTKLAQKDIEEHEKLLLEPIREKVNKAIEAVGVAYNFTVIYDLNDSGIVFISPNATDANPLVKNELGIQ